MGTPARSAFAARLLAACQPALGPDPSRINQNVRYLFNGQKTGAMTLPLPTVPGEK